MFVVSGWTRQSNKVVSFHKYIIAFSHQNTNKWSIKNLGKYFFSCKAKDGRYSKGLEFSFWNRWYLCFTLRFSFSATEKKKKKVIIFPLPPEN